jgi:hypothetical protein
MADGVSIPLMTAVLKVLVKEHGNRMLHPEFNEFIPHLKAIVDDYLKCPMSEKKTRRKRKENR